MYREWERFSIKWLSRDRGETRSGQLAHLRLQPVGLAHLRRQADLRFQVVDVFLGVLEDVFQQFARHVVAHRFAVRDGFLQQQLRTLLEFQIALQLFRYSSTLASPFIVVLLASGPTAIVPLRRPV